MSSPRRGRTLILGFGAPQSRGPDLQLSHLHPGSRLGERGPEPKRPTSVRARGQDLGTGPPAAREARDPQGSKAIPGPAHTVPTFHSATVPGHACGAVRTLVDSRREARGIWLGACRRPSLQWGPRAQPLRDHLTCDRSWPSAACVCVQSTVDDFWFPTVCCHHARDGPGSLLGSHPPGGLFPSLSPRQDPR